MNIAKSKKRARGSAVGSALLAVSGLPRQCLATTTSWTGVDAGTAGLIASWDDPDNWEAGLGLGNDDTKALISGSLPNEWPFQSLDADFDLSDIVWSTTGPSEVEAYNSSPLLTRHAVELSGDNTSGFFFNVTQVNGTNEFGFGNDGTKGAINLFLDGTGTINVASGITMVLSSSTQNESGPATIIKTGSGILVLKPPAGLSGSALAVTNSYSGGFTLSAGTVEFGDNSGTVLFTAFGSGTLTLAGGTLTSVDAANHTISNKVSLPTGDTAAVDAPNGEKLTLTGSMSGAGTLNANGLGTLMLSGSSTYTGQVNVNSGTLVIASSSGLGSGTGNVVVASGTAIRFSSAGTLVGHWFALCVIRCTGMNGNGGAFATTVQTPTPARFWWRRRQALARTAARSASALLSHLPIIPSQSSARGLPPPRVFRSRRSTSTPPGTLQIIPNATNLGTSDVKALSIAGGVTPTATFDITNNGFIVDYTGTSPIDTMRQQFQSAYASGSWSGSGIRSSSANSGTIGVAYGEASVVDGISGSGTATFDGLTVDATSVIAKKDYYGDANFDRKVNAQDFDAILSSHYADTGVHWTEGDFNYDGTVDATDYNLLSANFGDGDDAIMEFLRATNGATLRSLVNRSENHGHLSERPDAVGIRRAIRGWRERWRWIGYACS